jgi:hypothetical protein
MRKADAAYVQMIPNVTNQESSRYGEGREHRTFVRFHAAALDQVQSHEQQHRRYGIERRVDVNDRVGRKK